MVRVLGVSGGLQVQTRGKSFKINTASGPGMQPIEHWLVIYEDLASIPRAGKRITKGSRLTVLGLCCVLLMLTVQGALKEQK